MTRISSLKDFWTWSDQVQNEDYSDKCWLTICGGTGCQGSGCQKVIDAFQDELEGVDKDKVEMRVTGCHGFCEQGPLVVLRPENMLYIQVEPEDVPEILERSVFNDELIDRLLYVEPETSEKIALEDQVPFYAHQERIAFEGNGVIDPTHLQGYIAVDGYSALAKVLQDMTPEDVIEEIKKANLRGRGGAGFPAGLKWQYCRQEPAEPKYIICNADEGDPGAYMDRSLLEGNPHLIIEGMIIGGYAIGAKEGIIYVRTEYPRAVKHTQIALEQAREHGFLGENILGTDFDFDLEIMKGSGAFVAGESTALMASIEGRSARPRQTPPRSTEQGLWGKPTVLNNVETFGNVPFIINKGAEWFSSIGTEESKGTKIFSLVGKVRNTGLIEVPMGVTLREIVFDIGGGIPDDKEVKAVQTGGPSGGCIPKDLLDLSVDFEKLSEVGSMMGSGGMVVMDENTCMVDVAKYFLEFLVDESCGKCLPCRNGIPEMLEILERITQGEGQESDIEQLEALAETIRRTSLCGLGDSAPNPILSTLEYFRDEYEAHIYEKACPARVCRELISYAIDKELCRACDMCRKICPVDAISGTPGDAPYQLDDSECVRCGACNEECPFDAINILTGTERDEDVSAAS